MSRTQWCCLTALLAIVLGLLCGPVGLAPSYADASPSESVAVATGAAAPAHVAPAPAAPAPAAPAHAAPAPAVKAVDAGTPASAVRAAAIPDPGVPGCGKPGDHDSAPAVPARARGTYDQAPGLAPWGLPAATGALSAEETPGIRVRAPVRATPTPVELSVLRV
ncbi:hypothetical protein [Streptomyces sp. NPDC101178]|uniref:hypothetical protein n=1 Tax=Streptomyces sp. NPDC101178 TaxID=3366124 RepID=UPI003819EE64